MYVACPLTETKIHITPKAMLIPPYGPSKVTTTKYMSSKNANLRNPHHPQEIMLSTCQDLTHLQAEYLHILRTV